MPFKKGYRKAIDDRFSIHIAANSEEDLNAILDFNKQVHLEENIQIYIRSIMHKYPRRNDLYWLYIQDNKNKKIVSSLCLSRLDWQIEGIHLPVCEMEFVGTLEAYRRKGFIKILNELYEKLMEKEGYLISVIRGIPYFYRTLGYEYVSSLDERIKIKSSKIPNKKLKKITISSANLNNIALISTKYSQFRDKFYIFNKLNEECFKFKYLNDKFNSKVRSTYIINEDSLTTNYFSLGRSYDNKYYEIVCPDLTMKQANAVLQFIKDIGNYNDNDIIYLSLNKHTSLFNYIKSIGGALFSDYGWQVKIPDIKKFLSCIKEIIEARLEHSEFNNLTKSIKISNYRETIKLEVNKGKVKQIEQIDEFPDSETTDLRIPGGFLYMLLLGDRSYEEINDLIKDAIVDPLSKKIIETLFPKKPSLFESYI
ncbi:MAG: GNAT family N-acetyltransferase [Promethearchaeota archaeon]|nr:MAG: GNAT family N-acetyltransferase [Candidatus Lokiarchaeota archaeon]